MCDQQCEANQARNEELAENVDRTVRMADKRTSFQLTAQGEVKAHRLYRMSTDFHRELVTGDISSKQSAEPLTSLLKDIVRRKRIHYF